MTRGLISWISGLIFALGLGLSGMTLPQKVVGFLDVTGAWDPSLAFVMGGAIGMHLLAYRLIVRRPSPLLADAFQLPTRKDIDGRLIAGSALFGLGWGLGGFCPGPGIVASASGASAPLVFVAAMMAGMVLFHAVEGWLGQRRAATAPVEAR